ncbi:MAG: hypothetical protein ACTHOU_01965 [Aureliella sp.]|jgi:type II secretory pathway pseudopilin PulG
MKFNAARKALTLLELVVVLCILAALGGMVVPLCSGNVAAAADSVTRASLTEIRDALNQYWQDTQYLTLDGISSYATESQRFDLAWLFLNPVTGDGTNQFDPNLRSGWNGPYMAGTSADIATWGSLTFVDGWNRQFTVQYVNPSDDVKDVRIVSSGPDGVIDIPAATATAALTSADTGDDIYVALVLR